MVVSMTEKVRSGGRWDDRWGVRWPGRATGCVGPACRLLRISRADSGRFLRCHSSEDLREHSAQRAGVEAVAEVVVLGLGEEE